MANLGWDEGSLYYTNVLPGQEQREDSRATVEANFFSFVQNFRFGNNYVYRCRALDWVQREPRARTAETAGGHAPSGMPVKMCETRLGNIIGVRSKFRQGEAQIRQLSASSRLSPYDHFESAVKKSACKILYPSSPELEKNLPDCQVTLKSDANKILIRDLDVSADELMHAFCSCRSLLACSTEDDADERSYDASTQATHISKLVRIPGIIISASTLSSRATHVQIMCRNCRHTKVIPIKGGFSGIQMPRVCDSSTLEGEQKECPMDPYIIVHDKCKFVDQQTLKLQEAPDEVPVGELPRHMLLSVDRYLTNKVVPGTRTSLLGIYSIFQHKSSRSQGAVAIRTPYIRVVGLQVDHDTTGRGRRQFTEAEEEEFIAMSRMPHLYEVFANSIAPSIFGNSDIKKAIACLLFGGSRKVLPDGMKLRGDINILLLGDPGTAKSQLLKFVEKVSPIAVYTSGKGSSAAGLTASVIRDPGTVNFPKPRFRLSQAASVLFLNLFRVLPVSPLAQREFYLEGGAMVLADGGVVCIDEFDKMRDEDRVAIHEAMEQQTISIAKAGITTILNSRTSVLAAANPVFGRYDELKSAGERLTSFPSHFRNAFRQNIDFQTTILSRFDMIFIVRDEHNEQRDRVRIDSRQRVQKPIGHSLTGGKFALH
ncbi:MAG: MCM2/3/5 family-domain-containing protein [Olpidium bornovanus]|uniref:DNA replication licensing factor MCM5 n=1 Tax=Olpidium bornovanus TaxID=278681 RepID=A0A8H8DDV5_9FUNG|nr:MAG: MCM2/3/5 family-domain-containing protein [Olpidium bornovanus]